MLNMADNKLEHFQLDFIIICLIFCTIQIIQIFE